MLLAFLAIAAASSPDNFDKLERCRAAVHGALETAAEACRPSSAPVNLWAPETFPSSCRTALQRGHDAGKSASLPPAMRAGLVRYFDQAYAQCRAPAAEKELPTVDQVKLWD